MFGEILYTMNEIYSIKFNEIWNEAVDKLRTNHLERLALCGNE
jgi:hypothetical protein